MKKTILKIVALLILIKSPISMAHVLLTCIPELPQKGEFSKEFNQAFPDLLKVS
ncbi:hypothetical protein [Chromobacterium haemolyticum]|uniref:hypothetical protein n=1 Tax=Chromobacterium haemolyticum TaxID=394935 RepID=UPI001594DE03|nr:hypothetical protein [Chromobacterium haemolyticum]